MILIQKQLFASNARNLFVLNALLFQLILVSPVLMKKKEEILQIFKKSLLGVRIAINLSGHQADIIKKLCYNALNANMTGVGLVVCVLTIIVIIIKVFY